MDIPTYRGQPANQGRVIPYEVGDSEGYAVLKCGGTEVVLSYTLLHHLNFVLPSESPMWKPIADAQKGLDAITCEASMGRIPE